MNNDLISRQMAVDAICKEWCCCSHDDCENKTMMENGFDPCDGCSDVDAIMDLPSAQPERKPGKWEIYIISMLDGEGCRCSECGHEGVPVWDFCPGCGAKMEGAKVIK